MRLLTKQIQALQAQLGRAAEDNDEKRHPTALLEFTPMDSIQLRLSQSAVAGRSLTPVSAATSLRNSNLSPGWKTGCAVRPLASPLDAAPSTAISGAVAIMIASSLSYYP
jgi:hypothetical protein